MFLCIRLRASQSLSVQHLRFVVQPYILANAADPYSLLMTLSINLMDFFSAFVILYTAVYAEEPKPFVNNRLYVLKSGASSKLLLPC